MARQKHYDLIVIGGGAAGFFGAINYKLRHPEALVAILEKSNKLLSKVKISGGGRCNVTHHCFENSLLVKNYPRGEKELRSPFSKFSVRELIAWFDNYGIKIVAEADGRMFPSSNTSQTIIDLFFKLSAELKIEILLNEEVLEIKKQQELFDIQTTAEHFSCNYLLVSTGGHPNISNYNFIRKTGHEVIAPVPSLFTFNLPKHPITELMGTSVKEAEVTIMEIKKSLTGPLLITHWGLSGPAVLKLSAFAAIELHKLNYEYTVRVNWLPEMNQQQVVQEMQELRSAQPAKFIKNANLYNLPQRLWEFMLENCGAAQKKVADLSNQNINQLSETLTAHTFKAKGKTTYKEEFVTSGGVNLKEVNTQTFESKLIKNLFFAGEVLNIDGITGGFNFQNAWSSAFVAVNSIGV